MSITLYSKYKRQQLRRAWHFAGMNKWCLDVGLHIVGFIAALALVQYISDRAIAEDIALEKKAMAEEKQHHAEKSVISCLHGNGLWINGLLHTCSMINTGFTKESFK